MYKTKVRCESFVDRHLYHEKKKMPMGYFEFCARSWMLIEKERGISHRTKLKTYYPKIENSAAMLVKNVDVGYQLINRIQRQLGREERQQAGGR